MNICLSTIALEPNRWGGTRLPKRPQLERMIPLIAKGGVDAIEIWEGHALMEDAAGIRRCAELARGEGLQVPAIGAYLDFSLRGAALEMQRYKMSFLIDAAKQFGSTIIKYFAGPRPWKSADDEYKKVAVGYLNELCRLGEEAGVLMAAEMHGGTVTDCLEGAQWWMKQSRSPAHRLLFQPYGTDTQEAVEHFKVVAPHVCYIHVQGVRDKQYMLLENAELDFAAVMRTAKQCGFDGWVCIEFVADCTLPEAEFDDQLVLRNTLKDKGFLMRAWA